MKTMTEGKPLKLILFFMVPVLCGNLFQNFYNIADTMIVGRFLGVDALAAVGSTGSLNFLVIGWIMGMTSGFGIILSQAYGARDEKRLKHYIAMCMHLCIILAVIMTIGLLLANEWILRIMNTPGKIFQDTSAYIAIIYMGLPVAILYNMLSSIARALGDSKTPLYFLILSSILNIGLDLLFVAVLPFGVAGAAYATVFSQAVSAVLCFIYLWKKYEIVRFSREDMKISFGSIKVLLSMGIPMGLQFSITAIGAMIVQSSLNLLGAVYIAAYAAAMKIQNITMQVYVALGVSVATFVGQNYGAGKIKRIKEGINYTLIMVAVYSVLVMVFAYFVCPSLVQIFAEDPEGKLQGIAKQIFHISLGFYPFLGLIFIYRNALQGLGNGLIPMLGGIFELFARGIAVVLLFKPLGFVGICITDPAAWVCALIPLVPYYYWYMRKTEKKLSMETV